jgi:hypothetical protein
MTVSAAATGELSCNTVAATGPQQGEAAAASQVLVPRAPSLGREQARPESQRAGYCEAAGDAADDDAPPGWGRLGGQPPSAPERTPEVLVMQEDACVMLQHPAHDAEASASHAAPNIAVAQPVGDRPRGPLKQWGNPYLNSCINVS